MELQHIVLSVVGLILFIFFGLDAIGKPFVESTKWVATIMMHGISKQAGFMEPPRVLEPNIVKELLERKTGEPESARHDRG